MNFYSTSLLSFNRLQRTYRLEIKRFKYKKKWAMKLKQKSNTQLSLDHFDAFYKPVYDKLWPSIRVSLLSEQKYCALINNYCQLTSVHKTLESLGARDIVSEAATVASTTSESIKETNITLNEARLAFPSLENCQWHESIEDVVNLNAKTSGLNIEDEQLDVSDNDLHAFMPVTKVYSQREKLTQEIIVQNSFEPHDIQVETVKSTEISISPKLKAFTFPKGNVSDFPSPKPDSKGMLGYYLLDASSLLPVIALDLQPHDQVLDLCAAPGGKTLAMLQVLPPENITCNDKSHARMRRLQEMLRWYCPDKDNLLTSTQDGRYLNEPLYSKVLVDVPCNTDRHVLQEDDNNLFKPSRLKERLQLPSVQKELLLAGIKSCKPGGSVVYSTCTLSPAQNDGVIQAAAEQLWQETSTDIVLQDLSWLVEKFQHVFKFFDKCHHGQLVLPSLGSNFGPMYICKISRMN